MNVAVSSSQHREWREPWWQAYLSKESNELQLGLIIRWQQHTHGAEAFANTVWATKCCHPRTGDIVLSWFDGVPCQAPIGAEVGLEFSRAASKMRLYGLPRSRKGKIRRKFVELPEEARDAILGWLQERLELLEETAPVLKILSRSVKRQKDAVFKIMAKLKENS